MNITFTGRRVVVTGAAHGIGRGISLGFAQCGATLYLCDILPAELEETRALCVAAGAECHIQVVDVSQREQIMAFMEATGPAHVLVNNAGGVQGQVGRPLEEVHQGDWQAIFDVNVSAAFYFCQAAAPHMKSARWGRIVNISSGAGLGVSLTGIQAYAAAKAALVNLTRQLAHELGAWQITVNSVAPGFVLSNPATQRQWEAYGQAGQQALLERIALRRLGKPQDIAQAVLFLASDYASWVTGQVLSVDGGK